MPGWQVVVSIGPAVSKVAFPVLCRLPQAGGFRVCTPTRHHSAHTRRRPGLTIVKRSRKSQSCRLQEKRSNP